jgi:hypothetical protein
VDFTVETWDLPYLLGNFMFFSVFQKQWWEACDFCNEDMKFAWKPWSMLNPPKLEYCPVHDNGSEYTATKPWDQVKRSNGSSKQNHGLHSQGKPWTWYCCRGDLRRVFIALHFGIVTWLLEKMCPNWVETC